MSTSRDRTFAPRDPQEPGAKVKEAAPAALARPEDEERWAEEVQVSSFNDVRAKAQVALGKTPTRNMTLSLPRDVHALCEHTRRVTGQRAGVVLTQGEFVDLLLDAATRAGLTDGRLMSPPATGRAQEAGEEEANGEGSAGPTRIPPPTAVLHAFVCRCCEAVEVEGPDGPVTLAPERADASASHMSDRGGRPAGQALTGPVPVASTGRASRRTTSRMSVRSGANSRC